MRGSIGLIVVGLLSAWLGLPTQAFAVPAPSANRRDTAAEPTVLHRVVWDQYEKRGTHLWSANPDGSDRRRIYTRPKGFVEEITLNRQGTVAAVSPLTLSADRAALVLVDVLGERPSRNLIEDHPKIYFVGGIGWSPSGRKLVFEGAVEKRPGDLQAYLFTIRRDGTGLRSALALGRITDDNAVELDNALVWTSEGIFHYDQEGLHRLRHGRDRVVLTGVTRQAVSGDGTWLFMERPRGQSSVLWRMHPGGSGLEKLYRMNTPGSGYTFAWQPSYDGSRMLSMLEGVAPTYEYRLIAHDATHAPLSTDSVLPFTGVAANTWN